MSAADSTSGDQFQDLIFPGYSGATRAAPRRTYRGTVPKLENPETHRRLWRSTVGETMMTGHWANRPITAFGDEMYYMDVPHEAAEAHQNSDKHYVFHDRGNMPGRPHKVNQFYVGETTPEHYEESSAQWRKDDDA